MSSTSSPTGSPPARSGEKGRRPLRRPHQLSYRRRAPIVIPVPRWATTNLHSSYFSEFSRSLSCHGFLVEACTRLGLYLRRTGDPRDFSQFVDRDRIDYESPAARQICESLGDERSRFDVFSSRRLRQVVRHLFVTRYVPLGIGASMPPLPTTASKLSGWIPLPIRACLISSNLWSSWSITYLYAETMLWSTGMFSLRISLPSSYTAIFVEVDPG